MKTKKFIAAFAARTTCHGLDQITENGRPLWARIGWAFALAVLFSGLCWQLAIRVQEYLEFASDTELHEEFESYIDFPAVSICNYNRFFNITNHHELAAVDGLVRLTSPKRDANKDDEWETLIKKYYEDGNHAPFLSSEVEDKGWPLNDITIASCTFHQQPCSYRDYYSEHPDYGRPEAGIKVHVHEHDEPPMVEEFGIGIPSGFSGHVSIIKEERHLLHKPWGICNPEPKNVKYHQKYSFEECMTECRIDFVINRCNCKPYWAEIVEGVPECDVWQILDCSGVAEAESLNLTPDNCSCDQACSSVKYHHSLSYATYPSVQIGEILAADEEEGDANNEEDVESHIATAAELNLTATDPFGLKLAKYRSNHLMLDVYFSSLSYTKISQSKKVTEVSLISDFGGLFGLWLGISIVTLGEFIQFFIQLCALQFKGAKAERQKVTNNASMTLPTYYENVARIKPNMQSADSAA